MATDPLLPIAEELYGLPPGEFTGTRNQWAKQTKGDGDPELARRVAALRRPATAAWVVNMMMRHQGEQMAHVLDLGASLRQAQADLDADALRELTRQRRRLTTAVTRQGRDLARELGERVSDTVGDQVEDTLHAAMVDEGAAAAVRSGLLVSPLSATGVDRAGVVDAVAVPSAIGMTPRARARPPSRRPGLRAVPDAAPAPAAPVAGQPDADRAAAERAEEGERAAQAERAEREAREQAARQRVEEARAAADEAERRLRKARKRVSKLEARTLQTADELEQLRRRAAELEHELETLDESTAQARTRRDRAEERYAEAQERLTEARRDLEGTAPR